MINKTQSTRFITTAIAFLVISACSTKGELEPEPATGTQANISTSVEAGYSNRANPLIGPPERSAVERNNPPEPENTRLVPPSLADSPVVKPVTRDAIAGPITTDHITTDNSDTQNVTATIVDERLKTALINGFDIPPPAPTAPPRTQADQSEPLNITLITRRAEQGDVKSQVALGMAYANGTGRLDKDPSKAKEWLELASMKGDSVAQYELGKIFYTGVGAEQDYFNAHGWWLESAAQGNQDAEQKIGYLYSEGLGVKRDFTKAKLWYTKAAEKGHAEAQTLLGSLYHEGNRIPHDYNEAFKWYKLAAEQGHSHAQYTLATLYHDGLGTKVDYIQCAAWVDVAVTNGILDEFNARETCRGHLDELSNRTADHLAETWKKRYPRPAA